MQEQAHPGPGKTPKQVLCIAAQKGWLLPEQTGFSGGGLSSDPENPYRVDTSVWAGPSEEDLGQAFQVSKDNPLAGLSGRVEILRRLGEVLPEPEGGTDTRLGVLWDEITALSDPGSNLFEAGSVLQYLLKRLSPVWPDGLHLQGENAGDVGRHSLLSGQTPGPGLVPFHKLSHWLT